MAILQNAKSKYKILAYDPMKPSKEGPVTIEIWTAEGTHYPKPSKKLGELKLTKDEVKEFYSGGHGDKDKEKFLKKHNLMSNAASFNGSGDGDIHSMYLGVSGDEDVDGLFLSVKSGHEDALDAILDEE